MAMASVRSNPHSDAKTEEPDDHKRKTLPTDGVTLVVVNADDLGYDSERDKGIVSQTSTSFATKTKKDKDNLSHDQNHQTVILSSHDVFSR